MNKTLSIGLAMFSMFFGAGNIIFPLALGQVAQSDNMLAFCGLILTAVIIPFAGVLAMILFNGDTRAFFERLGKIPGLLLALAVITLLGPCGSTPRCIALTYGTLKGSFPSLSPILFSLGACLTIYLFAYRKTKMLSFLGNVLTPLLLLTLAFIVFSGLMIETDAMSPSGLGFGIFFHGLKEGYNTMDLLAAFFFSSAIIAALKEGSFKNPLQISMRAGFLGAFLLSIVYLGFSYLAAIHGSSIQVDSKDELLCAIAYKIAGPQGGLIVCTTIALACLTTAIALISVFSDFIQKTFFKEKVSYQAVLAGSLVVTFFVSTFEFNGISAFLAPLLQICYPGLIVLTLLNIAHKLTGFKPLKFPVFLTFCASAVIYLA